MGNASVFNVPLQHVEKMGIDSSIMIVCE